MRSFLLALAISLMAAAACASTGDGQGTRRDSNVITQDELTPHHEISAFQAIRRLRPNWLQVRGATRLSGAQRASIQVHVDGMHRGSVEELRSIRAEYVVEIRYMSASEATTRYGTGYTGGLILVTTGGDGPEARP